MLRLSKLTDYAAVILSHMVGRRAEIHAAAEVSSATRIAFPTVSKVLKLLAKAGILSSIRGAKGGYRFSRAPEKISVADVICAMEGPIALTECSISYENCEQSSNCEIRGNWDVINRAIETALESVTMTDLAMPGKTSPVEFKVPVKSMCRNQR